MPLYHKLKMDKVTYCYIFATIINSVMHQNTVLYSTYVRKSIIYKLYINKALLKNPLSLLLKEYHQEDKST